MAASSADERQTPKPTRGIRRPSLRVDLGCLIEIAKVMNTSSDDLRNAAIGRRDLRAHPKITTVFNN
jgi:hypothetical protein